MTRKNSGNLKVFSRGINFSYKGRFIAVESRLKESLVSYVELNIKLRKSFSTKYNIVISEVENKYRNIFLLMLIDFEIKGKNLSYRLSKTTVVFFNSKGVKERCRCNI